MTVYAKNMFTLEEIVSSLRLTTAPMLDSLWWTDVQILKFKFYAMYQGLYIIDKLKVGLLGLDLGLTIKASLNGHFTC